MPEFLRNIDHSLFHWINSSWSNAFFDRLMPVLTDLHKVDWLSKAVLPAILFFWILSLRLRAVKVLVGLVLCVGLADTINGRVLKPYFQRDRPAKVLTDVQLRTNPHYGLSFPSNHAANTFAAAAFLTLIYPWVFYLAFPLAFLVALSRVYVGVHFPLDVFCGALVGIALAQVFYRLWKRLFFYYDPRKHPRKVNERLY